MLKNMKYEFRRNALVFAIFGAAFVIAEILYLAGVAVDKRSIYGIGTLVEILLGFAGGIYIPINGINLYGRDLKDKSGYLVFMTPVSNYRIIGAKLLTILLETVVFAILTVLAVVGNAMFYAQINKVITLDEILEGLSLYFRTDPHNVVVAAAVIAVTAWNMLIGLYMIVTLAYFSISLSATVLQNKRGKGWVSFLLFFVLAYATAEIGLRIPELGLDFPESLTGIQIYMTEFLNNAPLYAFMVVICVASYIGTVKLLDRQISL